MTEKRFELTYFDCDYITDHNTHVDYPVVDKKSMFKVVELLNELHNENEQLKSENQELRQYLSWQDMELEEMESINDD